MKSPLYLQLKNCICFPIITEYLYNFKLENQVKVNFFVIMILLSLTLHITLHIVRTLQIKAITP